MRLAVVFLLSAPAVADDWESLYREGLAAVARGDYAEGKTLIERADRALPEDASVDRIVNTRLALATACTELGQTEAALEHLFEGRKRVHERFGPLHPGGRILTLRAGVAAMRLSRLAEAESLLCACLESFQLESDRESPWRRACVGRLAALAAVRGHLQLAQQLAEKSVERIKRSAGDDPAVADVLNAYGEVALETGEYPLAVMAFRRAISAWQKAGVPNPGFSAVMRASLARALAEGERHDEAAQVLDPLLTSLEDARGRSATLARLTATGALLELGRLDEARKLVDELRPTEWSRVEPGARAEFLLYAGWLDMRGGNAEAATACLRQLVRVLEDGEPHGLLAGRAHFAFSMMLARLGRHPEAVRHAEQALKLMWQGLGREHRLARMAVAAYEKTVAQARQAGVGVERLAWLDFDADGAAEYEELRRESSKAARNSEWDVARALADRAVALAPWKSEAFEDRARVRFRRDDTAGALEDLTRALKCDFRPETLGFRARVRWRAREHPRAIADATVHLEFEPGSSLSWLVRGSCHTVRLQFDLGARNFARVESGPDFANAKWGEVLAHLAMREPEKARAVLDSDGKLRGSPKTLVSRFHAARAVANFAVGRFEAAAADCSAALRADARGPHVDHHPLLLRAIVRQEAGDREQADRDLEAYLAQEPESWDGVVYAAYGVWERDGGEAAARFVADRIAEQKGDDSLLAVARCVAGKVSRKELAQRARAAEPLEACRLYYHLGRIHKLAGDARSAAESFRAAAAIDAGPLVEYWAAARRTKQ